MESMNTQQEQREVMLLGVRQYNVRGCFGKSHSIGELVIFSSHDHA